MLNAGMGAGDITERLLRGLGGNDTGFQLQPRCAPRGFRPASASALRPGALPPRAAGRAAHGAPACAPPSAASARNQIFWLPSPAPSSLLPQPPCFSASHSQAPALPSHPPCPLPTPAPAPAPAMIPRRYGPCEPSDLQDRMRSAVALLGESEVRAIVAEQGKIEVGGWLPPPEAAEGAARRPVPPPPLLTPERLLPPTFAPRASAAALVCVQECVWSCVCAGDV